MKKTLIAALLFIALVLSLAACGEHEHDFSDWTNTIEPSCDQRGLRERFCYDCDYRDTEYIDKIGHTEVIDAAVEASCTVPGKTQGSHCSVCGEVIVAQQDTELAEHDYSRVLSVIEQATCLNSGRRKVGCANCSSFREEEYALEELDANTVYEYAIKFTGEIITYAKNGDPLAIGTGFVYSSDGKIVTNYHVIDGAYSAQITIGDKTYVIQSVLAYSADIDLAVLKINASDLVAAPVCSQENAVGKTVYAYGSSKGLTGTFSQGIITYSNRVLGNVSYIQHDAAISSGNSGGPLLNSYGEVIAVNTMTRKDSQNLNFAVSVAELDNLNYGTPTTLDKLFGSSTSSEDLRDEVIAWVLKNGEKDDDYYEYSYELAKDEYASIVYYPDDDYLTVDYYYLGDMTVMFSLYLDEGTTEYFYITSVYDAEGEDVFDLYGVLEAANYKKDASVKGYEFESYYSYTDTAEGKAWAETINVLNLNTAISFLDSFLSVYGLASGAEAFGFTNY